MDPDLPLFQVEHHHISIHHLLKSLQVPMPGQCWQKLQQHPSVPLPPHTLKQFTMRDGRKGRLTPAVHVRHQHHLMQALQHAALMEAPIQELYPAERAFLRLLEHECQEHLPRRLWRAGPWPFDLYFEHGPLVVQCKRTTLHALTRLTVLQARHGVQGVLVDPHQKDFPSEHWVEVVRYTLQKETR